jgi:hypothetical protein
LCKPYHHVIGFGVSGPIWDLSTNLLTDVLKS